MTELPLLSVQSIYKARGEDWQRWAKAGGLVIPDEARMHHFSHVLLAIVNLPMIIMTVIPAVRERYDKHRRIAKWTAPIWLYVSVTGVLVYLMCYKWFGPPVL